MAVAFPFDQITNKPIVAINKLQTALNKVIAKLNQKVADVVGKTNTLSKNISCNDVRIKEIKQLLQQIQRYIEQIQNILRILNIVVPILTIAAQIASVIINGQLAIPIPSPPAVSQTLAVQNELVANIAKALTQASVILVIVNGAVSVASKLIGPVINTLSSVCNTETFEVNQITKNVLDSNTEVISTTDLDSNTEVISTTDSDFYRLINVSQQDIDLREELIVQLQEQQRSLLTDLLEAPSRVIISTSTNPPDFERGKAGDYFINQTTRTIYGPKISDTEWPAGINY